MPFFFVEAVGAWGCVESVRYAVETDHCLGCSVFVRAAVPGCRPGSCLRFLFLIRLPSLASVLSKTSGTEMAGTQMGMFDQTGRLSTYPKKLPGWKRWLGALVGSHSGKNRRWVSTFASVT